MKLIKPSYSIIEPTGYTIDDIYKSIELAGRVCYKSEDKITENSAREFVNRMIKSGHGAMLEHGTVFMFIPIDCDRHDYHVAQKYHNNKYSRGIIRNEHFLLNKNGYYITTNLRVLVENEWMNDLKYICDLTEFHEKRATVHFVCDRGVSHEFVRHRVFSFAQESTRYCNYSKDKFGNELTFIIPCWLDIISEADEIHIDGNERDFCYPEDIYTSNFLYTLRYAERAYLDLLQQWDKRIPDKRYKSGFRNNPWTPQQARAVLPNSLKTELVMTGFVSDWEQFFKLRTAPNAHPQMRELTIPLQEEFISKHYIK